KHISLRCSNQGFTMVELLVAMVVALLAMGAIYSTFLNQQKSYVVQGETAAMHQNIRAAMFYMQREIRMAGCDPLGSASAGISLAEAKATSIRFTEDVSGGAGSNSDGDVGDPNEDITYSLDGNGNLVRTDNNVSLVSQIVAQNIDAIDFVYLDGASNVLNAGGPGGDVPAGSEDQIRSVEVTIVAKTGRNTLASPNNNAYLNQRGFQILVPQIDHFSRRRLTASIKCRNLGL
ncbi:MAG: prepilin-type N-terminal cleavage/methylation domain-containing protein, partial [Desulfobacterales bacterium]|nr:prepilin-type N-terminal cleavage/methylation domain-containing protein [Desulfobacterales bacterium]